MVELRLTWSAPFRADGAATVTLRPDGTLRETAGVVARPYSLDEHPELYRVFSAVESAQDAAVFSQLFGFLDSPSGNGVIEQVDDWLGRAAMLREMTGLWDVARPDSGLDEERLYPLVRWTPGGAEVFSTSRNEWLPAPGPVPLTRREAAMSHLAWRVNDVFIDLMEAVPVSVVASEDGVRLELRPPTLWVALLLQFSASMANRERFRRCANCGLWLLEKSAMKDAPDRTACSQRCRQVLFRRRRADAVRLAADGMKAEVIAAGLSTPVATVRKWLAEIE